MIAVTNIRQLITMAGPAHPRTGEELRQIGLVEDACLLVGDDGRIRAAGPRAGVPVPADAQVVDAGGMVVMPGFVDAHTHPVFAGQRADEFELRASGHTYQEIAAKGGGIRSTVRQTRAATADQLLAIASRYAFWFLRGGTTTIEAKSGYGLTLDDEVKMLRCIRRLGETTGLRCVPTFLGAHEIPDEFRGRRREYGDLIIHQMLPAITRERLAEYCDVFCEPDIFDIEESRRVLMAARSFGLGLRMHADQLSDSDGSLLAAELRVQTADHLENADRFALQALQHAGVQPVLLPASVYALGSRLYPDARGMIETGLAIVLATDFNPGTSPTTSMPFAMSLAVTQMKMTPAEALSAATINAAHSLGRGAEIGSLEPGKLADFVIYEARDWREIVYWVGVPLTRCVYAGGKLVFAGGPGAREHMTEARASAPPPRSS
jgi:imidazolonepropionase